MTCSLCKKQIEIEGFVDCAPCAVIKDHIEKVLESPEGRKFISEQLGNAILKLKEEKVE